MNNNMNVYGGVIFSQKVLLLLVDKGISREKAYRLVQKNAHDAWNKPNGDFRKNIKNDSEISKMVSEAELNKCFDPSTHLINLNVIWERLGLQ